MDLPCIIKHVIFRNDNGFGVLSCDLDRFSNRYTIEMEEQIKEYINPKYNSFTITTLWPEQYFIHFNFHDHEGQGIFAGCIPGI